MPATSGTQMTEQAHIPEFSIFHAMLIGRLNVHVNRRERSYRWRKVAVDVESFSSPCSLFPGVVIEAKMSACGGERRRKCGSSGFVRPVSSYRNDNPRAKWRPIIHEVVARARHSRQSNGKQNMMLRTSALRQHVLT